MSPARAALFLLFGPLFFSFWPGSASGEPVQLETLVVTAGREDKGTERLARPVQVLDKEDLRRMPGTSLVEVLAREAGLVPREGVGKSGGLDIRGMGDTSSSNVLVLLDDVPMNARDLSGVDFSTIAMEDIERIEIIRGSGAVHWGSGAVGGVIRIITKKPTALSATLFSETGSFGYRKNRIQTSGSSRDFSFRLYGGHHETSGYRENSDFNVKDAGLDLRLDQQGPFSFGLSGHVHGDTYGLPGPVTGGRPRKSASTPHDGGETFEKRFTARAEGDFDSFGTLKLQRSLRYRDQKMDMTGRLSSEGRDNLPVDIELTEKILRTDYHLPLAGNSLHLGFDHLESHYIRTDPDANLARRHNGRIIEYGVFAASDFALRDSLRLTLGGRYHHVDADYRYDRMDSQGWRQHSLRSATWTKQAWDAGLVYEINSGIHLYTSYASSFRSPNVDELAKASKDLKPQETRHMELGLRSFQPGRFRLEAGLFSMEADDEIYYDSLLQENRNYEDTTLRRGLETSLSLYPSPFLSFRLDMTLMQARFEKKDKVIPLVPERHAGLQISWEPVEVLGFYLAGRWFDSRYDGNDFDNREKKLDAFHVWDIRARLNRARLEIFMEINNMLDEDYAMAAYSGAFYPMPGRQFKAGVTLWF
ncbi:outer membrane cobalamin receptor [Desulfobotulus alkaliphilus]|uniref:Outer membrane cobalamin receptor n=1 Tax=Desulfobotulus alkaliphilus TaxID=622671 RepID=A0A562RQ42_9BACT|nr:TonB-dependent receptor [Desulfobotulus alkaliphilus]TWI71132.1 outer membrane cobalamin receptor [Desulfobotulus alkaliphilus]